MDRRRFLSGAATGLGSIALASLLSRDGLLAGDAPPIDPARPYAPRATHFPPRAKNVVVIFCAGAVSHIETWDYKPGLIARRTASRRWPRGDLSRPRGQPCEAAVRVSTPRRGGKMVSDMLPHLAELTDDIAFVHSLTSKSNTHGPAENFLSTGSVLDGFPSLGSWVTYALGSENQDLPAYIAIPIRAAFRRTDRTTGGRASSPRRFRERPSAHRSRSATSSRRSSPARRIEGHGASSSA